MQKKLLLLSTYATLLMLGVYLSFYQYTIYRIALLFSMDGAMMGLAIGIQSLGMAIPPLLLGALSERIGKKRVVLIAYGLMITGTALAGLAVRMLPFLVSSFLIGAGFAVMEATLSAVLADEFPDSSARHLNFSQVAFSIGAVSGPMLAAALVERGVYFKHLYFYCSVAFLAFGAAFVFTRHQRDVEHRSGAGISAHLSGFLKNRVLLWLAAAVFFYVGVENTVANFADAYFLSAVKMPSLSAAALSLFWGAMIPSRFLAGLIKTPSRAAFAGFCLLAFLGILAAMLALNPTVKLAMFALCGFGCGPLWPLLMNRAAKAAKGSSGAVLNIMFSFCATGGALLPVLAGTISNSGDIARAYYLSAAAVVCTLLLWRKASRPALSSAEKMM